jgi:hypothetical protein
MPSMKNYLYVGALAVPFALANYLGFRVHCEVHGAQCQNDPDPPHVHGIEPISVAGTNTIVPTGPVMPNGSLTLTGTGDVTADLTGIAARFSAGELSVVNGTLIGNLSGAAAPGTYGVGQLTPITTGTMVNNDPWS